VVDPDLAEEAVQEALVRAWRSCSSFDPNRGPLVVWLLVITRNVAIDLVKARTRRPPVAPDSPRGDRPAEQGISHEDAVLLRSELVRALSGIGPTHRQVIVETLLRDRSHADVAADLGVPTGTVRSRVHYALRHLRVQLEAAAAA
jgi:RNA polymerase sigma-70 factor (ECF subfamily)